MSEGALRHNSQFDFPDRLPAETPTANMIFRLRSLLAVRSRLLPLGMCLCVWFGLLSTSASAAIEVVKFGWDAQYQPGRWTPLRVAVTEVELSDELQFEVIAADAEGNLNSLRQAGVATGTKGEYELRFKLGRIGTDIQIRLLKGDEVLSQTVHHTTNEMLRADLSLNRHLLAVLTREPQLVNQLVEYLQDPEAIDDEPIQIILPNSANELPVDPVNWASLDALILSSDIPLTSEQSQTLQQWVREGGHLLLSLKSDPENFATSPLAQWVPIELGNKLSLRDLSQFESYVGQSSRIVFSGRISAIELAGYDGNKVLDSLDGTLVASLNYGFGQITVSGVDLTRPPLASWDAMPRLIRRLAFPGQKQAQRDAEAANQQLTDSGISELATQLNLAQQNFSSVYRSNTWMVMAAIAAYLLLIGPLDYLLVHRVLKRPELTWVTFPLLICLTAVVTVWAGRSSNEIPMSINQVDLIDIDQRQSLVRVKSWMTVYNTQTQRIAVESASNLPGWSKSESVEAQDAILSWDAIPEDGFGGLYRQSGFEFSRARYHSDTASTLISDLPMDQWSTRSLTNDQFVMGLPLVESDLEASTLGNVSGTVVHQLPGELVDWMLVYRKRVYFPRQTVRNERGFVILPNQPVELTRNDLSASRDLKGYLTGTRQVQVKSDQPGADSRIVVEKEAYDLLSTDPRQIIRMLSFHEAAGGQDYTRLQNSALERFDWSPYLHPHQAVLYGVLRTADAKPQAVNWTLNGETVRQDSQTTIVRCLLPVKLKNDSRRVLPELDPNKLNR